MFVFVTPLSAEHNELLQPGIHVSALVSGGVVVSGGLSAAFQQPAGPLGKCME